MKFTVRRACPNDEDVLFGLAQRFATSFLPNREAFDDAFGRLLRDEAAWLAVAEHDGAVMGYCLGFDHFTFYANGRVSWVEEIMVGEDWRRQGAGAQLMSAFEAWARSRGSKLVALATRRASSFYAALGYEDSATYFRKAL